MCFGTMRKFLSLVLPDLWLFGCIRLSDFFRFSFAQWVEGVSDHIQDQEMTDHDSNPSPRIVYDDIHP